jgi:hypothetical protein
VFSVSTGSARQIRPLRSRGMECSYFRLLSEEGIFVSGRPDLAFGQGLRLRYVDRPEVEKGNMLDSQRPPEARPGGRTQDPARTDSRVLIREAEVAARSLKVQLQVVDARSLAEFERAFAAMIKERVSAILVLADVVFLSTGDSSQTLRQSTACPRWTSYGST